jgi:ribose transport system ATP-binding protein
MMNTAAHSLPRIAQNGWLGGKVPMNGDRVLRMESISKAFPGVQALDEVSFDIRPGEVHTLLGHNGAGKSTLVKILSGAYTQDAGTVYMNGSPINILNPLDSYRAGIRVIHQELSLVPTLSVAENLFLGREPLGHRVPLAIDQKTINQESRRALEDMELDIAPETKVRDLPIGQQQMVEITRAVSTGGKVVIMDEPTSALTEHETALLFDLIRKLKNAGLAIMYISHRLQEVLSIGDRATVLRDGKVVGNTLLPGPGVDGLVEMMVGRRLKQTSKNTKRRTAGAPMLIVSGLSTPSKLSNVNLSLCRGEIVGLFGLMGAGRTELLNAIFGVDSNVSGSVYIDGVRVDRRSPKDSVERGIGLLTEDRRRGLVLPMTVQENLTLASIEELSRVGVVDETAESSLAESVASRLDIRTTGLKKQKVRLLSGGNQQKVVLGKWLCRRPKLLLFDEPTRGVDVETRLEIYELMYQLAADDMAILVASSDLDELVSLADRVVVLRDGRVAGELTAEEATQERLLGLASKGGTH